ncbi:FAD/NAD(P)-binding domain-containing protein [Punctularia strigosozonata HHB-11173 SS5]|uniref:FAD/NAD(P)-binding domain-containing protein n=1 Tax=Punctularia strigosozonata (strain HHB-11173) TaxID=741275 RepID=UPI0004417CE2|nr:FAD/NAD(P)-binding domain-containing protein [Punctularia strigosozonata HHB-11173 SS5]EIN06885.1 FAD/NAD(P)-binding domain-containing protein [Punctularia strigosozonata HHB-11173 SS5]
MIATEVNIPPQHVQILVIGGGPAGSYAASALAREGFDVAVFEMSQFPRYHIGESLIPSVRQYLRFVEAEETIATHGFARKPGAAMKLNQGKTEGYTDFCALGPQGAVWNVNRSEFDKLLLDHAAESGARVYQQTKVTELHFESKAPGESSETDLGRPRSASYTQSTVSGARTGQISFDYLVDASGRTGIMSNKYLKNRKYTESLKNVAFWGYWRGTSAYMKGSGLNREGAAYFEALTDESGWAWFIPLANGITSVGIVMNQKIYTAYNTHGELAGTTLQTRYKAMLKYAPHILGLIGDATVIDDHPIKMASDFSYNALQYAGDGWRIVGDAGAFIDPFFSSGIHLALTGGLSSAITISAAIRGDCTEKVAAEWHNRRIGVSYTRFLVVVLGAYKQIRSQSSTALADVDEDNFDRAFSIIRPLIQGAADMGAHLHESELDDAVGFCGNLIAPVETDTIQIVRDQLKVDSANGGDQASNLSLLDVDAPIQDPAKLEHAATSISESTLGRVTKSEALALLNKVNARRIVHRDHNSGVSNFEREPLMISDGDQSLGWVARLKRGNLGLVRADVQQ